MGTGRASPSALHQEFFTNPTLSIEQCAKSYYFSWSLNDDRKTKEKNQYFPRAQSTATCNTFGADKWFIKTTKAKTMNQVIGEPFRSFVSNIFLHRFIFRLSFVWEHLFIIMLFHFLGKKKKSLRFFNLTHWWASYHTGQWNIRGSINPETDHHAWSICPSKVLKILFTVHLFGINYQPKWSPK